MSSAPPQLKGDDLHIWRVDLAHLVNAEPQLRRILSEDESQRADKYHFEKDRTSFVIRRGMLRRLLGAYVDIEPADLRFAYNKFDKPELQIDASVSFNTSSARDVCLLAFTLDAGIGIDIEYIDTEFPKMEIAERYFSANEVKALRAFDLKLQTDAFFDCWTKKEAYVKAVGEGMSRPLPHFDISVETPGSFAVTASGGNLKEWSFESFIPEENFIASIAYAGGQRSHSYFRWTGTGS